MIARQFWLVPRTRFWDDLAQGFGAMLPLWAVAVPSALAYTLGARAVGLNIAEIGLMSLLVYSVGTQLSVVGLLGLGARGPTIILATLILNAYVVLVGLALGRRTTFSWKERLVAAYFLTDGAYAVSLARDRLTFPFLLGAELSMFAVWNGTTLAGMLLGQHLPAVASLGIDFVIPLAFLGLLIPLLKTRADLLAAGAAASAALVTRQIWPDGPTVLVACVLGSLAGMCWSERGRKTRTDGASQGEAT
jgi:predicted branched-subunit amino acid permease